MIILRVSLVFAKIVALRNIGKFLVTLTVLKILLLMLNVVVLKQLIVNN